MKRLEIIKNNTLIAEFMNIPKCDRCHQGDCDKYAFGTAIYHSPLEMDYHVSWNWLMPVVEKIESLGFEFNIKCDAAWVRITYFRSNFPDDISEVSEDKKYATYNTSIKFIKWYNQNNK